MNEQIEKQAIEEMAKVLKDYTKDKGIMASHVILDDYAEALYKAGYRRQSEDTVEVVRCKDCKFNVANMEKDALDTTDYSGDDIVCSYFMTDGLEPTDFCSYGAKMKGATDGRN